MPTYSCHIPDSETADLDRAIATQSGGKEGPWIREAVNQRLEREGFIPGTKEHARREKLAILEKTLSDAEIDALVAGRYAAAADGIFSPEEKAELHGEAIGIRDTATSGKLTR